MVNAFLKPETIVNTGLGILVRELVLGGLFTTLTKDDFKGAKNDTVSFRIPAVLTAREYAWRNDRSSPIVIDDLTETKVDVTLNHDLYSAVKITDEQLTLDISDFGYQVLNPQLRAVGEAAEGIIATALAGATYNKEIDFIEGGTGKTGDPYLVAVEARKWLNRANVPQANRYLLLGADVEAAFLATDKLVKVNESGSDNALREAIIGRLAGFTVVVSNSIDPQAAYAVHSTAVVVGTVAPANPAGAVKSAANSYQGWAMRWLQDYDPTILSDRSIVSTFAGATAVADGAATDVIRAVKINFQSTTDAPVVTAATPSAVAATGTVTIKGTDFVGATDVKFGATSATSFVVVSSTKITAVMPAGSAGSAAVTVITPDGTSNALAYTRGA
jgi:hypothetical protein